MAYTALPEIQRRMELARALAASQTSNTGTKSGAITSGLASAINQFRSGRLAKQASEAQSENERLRTAEMQRLAGALAGQAQPPLRAGVMPNFSTPEVQDLATKYQMDQAMEEAKAKRAAVMNPPSMSLSPQWGIDADGNYVPMQLSSAGGMFPIETPEGVRMLPSAGLAGFDPSLIAQKGQAQTGVDVSNIQATTAPRAAQAGAIEAATQAARIGALPEQLAIQGAGEVAQVAATETSQRQRDANSVLSLLDMAEPLLDTATGSTAGTLRDQALALAGMSTEGARASAQLKALGGLLISKMPRMQGPQSNLDVQLYREMAGQIGDSTVPIDTRRAAMQTIRALNEKYAGMGQSQPMPQSAPIAEITPPQSVTQQNQQDSALTPEEQAELDFLRQQYGRP